MRTYRAINEILWVRDAPNEWSRDILSKTQKKTPPGIISQRWEEDQCENVIGSDLYVSFGFQTAKCTPLQLSLHSDVLK